MSFTVLKNLDESYFERWQKQFVEVNRDYLESIWRRSEDAESSTNGKRRRIIHVVDKYDMIANPDDSYDFAVTQAYIWLCSTLPREEMKRYVARINDSLLRGSWNKMDDHWTCGELKFSFKIVDRHPMDMQAGREFGLDYQTIECTVQSRGFPDDRIAKESPWAVYDSGIRKQGKRVENPTVVTDPSELLDYLPAQIELGGGASLELGVPPLNYFHTVYNLYTKSKDRFAYGDTDKFLDEFLVSPEQFYSERASLPYARALTAKPNQFYLLMADLYKNDTIVGPVITNNFDGICSLVGLEEMYVRRYDETHIIPDIKFHPEAKSLLVIGSHADRRRIQQAAKDSGLKVIYVDPETYLDHDGNVIPYPLEKIEYDDILVPLAASEFAAKLNLALVSTSHRDNA